MTPYGQRPLDLGADIVVAADTKAPNGHSDALFGHVASRDAEIIAAVEGMAQAVRRDPRPVRGLAGASRAGDAGGALRPHVLVGRDDRAAAEGSSDGEGAALSRACEDDPSHNLARVQMERFGFLIGLTLESEAAAENFIDGCALIQPATSFGGVHTSAERRARWGDAVAPGFVRLSVGCEPVEELWSAMEERSTSAS